jgi:AraC-like DNA-binding protein
MTQMGVTGLLGSVRSATAPDVGGIELLFADYHWHRFPPHCHDEYSISVTRRGGLAFDHRGSKHVAGSGIISAVDPGDMHNAYPAVDSGWAFVCLLVPVQVMLAAGAQAGVRGMPSFASRVIDDPATARRLVELADVLERSPDALERESLTLLTLGELVARHSSGAAPAPARVNGAVARARRLLDDPEGDRLTLAQLSTAAGLSPFHFIRTFRDVVGVTPHAYLNGVRIARARKMLAEGLPPADVALSCGFCDQSHLGRLFKADLGVTPGQYQAAAVRQR